LKYQDSDEDYDGNPSEDMLINQINQLRIQLAAKKLKSLEEKQTASDLTKSHLNEPKLLIVANRLPVTVTYSKGESHGVGNWKLAHSSGGLASSLSSVVIAGQNTWIGWPGSADSSHHSSISKELTKYDCVPVWLSDSLKDLYYDGFSNDVLWPLFHYVLPKIQNVKLAEERYAAYEEANQLFANVILQEYKDGDTVWIHDYHLFLLPSILRAAKPFMTIGFFLHIPWPSSEIYRMLPWRETLLNSLLASNLIGFHTYEYQRHFRLSCARVLGLRSTQSYILTSWGETSIGTFPIGIAPENFINALKKPITAIRMRELEATFNGKKVLLGIDRLDYIKGIPLKLLAFERFLQMHSEWIGKCVLVQIVVPSRNTVEDYANLAKTIHELVARINGVFGSLIYQPIVLLDQSIEFAHMCALMRSSSVCICSSIRDGMNLVAYGTSTISKNPCTYCFCIFAQKYNDNHSN
jgi:trehalose-6-phosphate synthase